MATNRLTFLYPHLFRSTGRWSEPAASQVSQSITARGARRKSQQPPSFLYQQQHHGFTSPSVGRQAAFAKRAGKGQNHQTHHPSETQAGPIHDPPPPPPPPPPNNPPRPLHNRTPSPSDIDPITQTKKGSPMDEILHMGPPPSSSPSPSDHPPPSPITPSSPSEPPPSITTSPSTTSTSTPTDQTKQQQKKQTYIHHFDSYSLVKHLSSPPTNPNYTLPQSIALMKAIRALLAHNLDNAQSGLVSRSDVDNETYLFRAACSELSAEVRKNRRVADEQLRQQRTHLQHEVDILTQRLNQDLLTLTDSVRGMFNDRRMAVREEQKAVESRIQQINYKISVMLNSDAKSDIEEVRWVLIRRSVLGIVLMAVLTLGTLRYATFVNTKRKKEAEEKAKEEAEVRRSNGMKDHSHAPEAAQILAAS
ncbi:hypothetical protein B0T21DRAFT_402861 [Apiosordaria backusii]|uniref:MOZ protein represents a chromatin-associated acetyltransferase n=1 Tax=Apiosordaria backusii TaxID=314023 RepID=A0AA40BEJ9_9PEZI|nr:hypothetical protein B0T21DRAFT_402861 [Apiosordaria backusii]